MELLRISKQGDESMRLVEAAAAAATAEATAAKEAASRSEEALRAQLQDLEAQKDLLVSEKEWTSETLAGLQVATSSLFPHHLSQLTC